jgi:hypothetical protein
MNTPFFHRAGLSTAVAATLGLLASTGSADWAPNGNRIGPQGTSYTNVQIDADPFAGLLVTFYPSYSVSEHLTRILPAGGVAAGWPISVTPNFGWISAPVADGIAGAYVAISRQGQVVVRRFLPDGTPDPTWPTGGSEICSATGMKYAEACSDEAGGLYVIWTDGRNADASTYGFGGELYGARVLADGSIASGWNAQGTLIAAAPESVVIRLGWPRPDGLGGAFVYIEHAHGFATPEEWTESRLGHVGPDGALPPGWPSGGFFPPGVTRFGYEPDGAGGAYVHWAKAEGGTYGSRLLRILASGETAPGWPAGGIPMLADSANFSVIWTLAGDGAGGVFADVVVDTSGITLPVVHRIYHFEASGEPAPDWPAEGRRVPAPIDTNPDWYWNPPVLLAGDMTGGVFAAWAQTALGSGRFAMIAAMHWDPEGNPASGWPEGGRAVCDTLGSRASLHIAADLIGETYVVWNDHRPPDPDYEFHTYASRLDLPKTVSVRPAARIATPLDAAPNPFAGAVDLRMTLAEAGAVRLGVFDLGGRIVRRLQFGWLPAGAYTRRWDGRADDGSEVPAGLYFVRGSVGAHAVGARLVRVR